MYLGQQSQLDAYQEQQRRAAAPQQSTSSYQQEQYRSNVTEGQQYQQVSPNQPQQRVRSDSERQRQDEQGNLFLSQSAKQNLSTERYYQRAHVFDDSSQKCIDYLSHMIVLF